MGRVSPMKRTKNTAKTVRIDRKRTRKGQDLAMQADRANKRADQFVAILIYIIIMGCNLTKTFKQR